MNRRDFLRTAAAGAALALAPRTLARAPMPASTCSSTSRLRRSPPISTATSSSTSAPSSTTASGSASSRSIPNTQRHPAGASSITCGGCRKGPIRWPGGCFADSYDWRDGVGRATRGRGAPTSGPARPDNRTARASTTRITSAPTISSASAVSPAASRISPPTCAACRRATSINGSSTATRRRGRRRWPSCGRRAAARSVQRALLGRRQRELGLRRQLHARGIRDRVSAASRRGCPRYGVNLAFIASGPTAAT